MKTREELERENALLRKKLEVAKLWMSKEVKDQIQNIWTITSPENIEDNIQNQIENFFEDIVLINLPTAVIQNIITSEINYHHMIQWQSIGWSSVIIGYHKALDALIEKNITKNFRKFAKKTWHDQLGKNDPLEKALHQIVNNWHTMSIGRLYHLLKMIKNGEHLEIYSLCFKQYLDKYSSIEDVLLSDIFTKKLSLLIKTEVLWKKRHIWNVTAQETKKVRDLLIWNFQDESCIIYSLIETSKIEF